MRPRRIILLVEPDEIEQSALAYALTVAGFRVLRPDNPHTLSQSTAIAARIDAALLSNRPPKFSANTLARKLGEARRGLPICILSDKADPSFPFAAMTVDRRLCPMAELIERLKVLCHRKRGPRKGAQRKAASLPGDTA